MILLYPSLPRLTPFPPHSTLPLLLAHSSPPISQAVLVSSGPWPWSLCCSGCLPFCQGWQHRLSNVIISPFLCISLPHSLTVHLLVDSKGCCDVISSSIPGKSISLLPLLSYTSFKRQTRSLWHPFTSNLSFLRKALCPLHVFQVWY